MKINNNFYDDKFQYQPVCGVSEFLEHTAKRGQLEIKKQPSFFRIFHLILDQINFCFSKILEDLVGIKFYIKADDGSSPDISPEAKRLISNLFQKKIILGIRKRERFFADEPEIIRYETKVIDSQPDLFKYSDGRGANTISGGADLNEEKSIMKAVGEGMERFCLFVYREKNLLLSPFSKISKKAISPLSFAGISPKQRESNPKLKISEGSLFGWAKGFSLPEKKEVFIPAQTVYIGYNLHPKEPIIRAQISTGTAAAESLEEALYKGICEAVERDAFMITYLNKLSPPIIDLDSIKDKEIQNLISMLKRYNLELYVVDITTDIKIPSIMTIIIDRSGVGRAVMVSTKTDLNIKQAIRGNILESIRARVGFRELIISDSSLQEKMATVKHDQSKIKTATDRFLFWFPREMIKEINCLLQGSKKKISIEELNQYQNIPIKERLAMAINFLKRRNADIYGIDITVPEIREEGIYVAKAISPQLQPLFLDERLKHFWGERLFNVPVILGYRDKPISEEELNQIPHPFL